MWKIQKLMKYSTEAGQPRTFCSVTTFCTQIVLLSYNFTGDICISDRGSSSRVCCTLLYFLKASLFTAFTIKRSALASNEGLCIPGQWRRDCQPRSETEQHVLVHCAPKHRGSLLESKAVVTERACSVTVSWATAVICHGAGTCGTDTPL